MPQEQGQEEPYPSQGYAWYVVGVLTFVYIFSFIDRQILNLLVRPIRRDLGITDFQMSLLMGFSFALFYTFFGIASAQQTWNVPIVGATRPWQVVFFIVGLPGVLLSLVVYTVREPVRRGIRMIHAADDTTRVAQVPMREVVAYLRQNWRTFFCH